MNFLWTTFTRFEPAADIHAAAHGAGAQPRLLRRPIVIDARLKPGLPARAASRTTTTAATVTRRWKEYFPGGMEMGDSEAAHLDRGPSKSASRHGRSDLDAAPAHPYTRAGPGTVPDPVQSESYVARRGATAAPNRSRG